MSSAEDVIQGQANRKAGTDFEKKVEPSFSAYAKAGIAHLAFMPLPMTPCGRRGSHGEPLYIPKGRAPFDVYGFRPRMVRGAALASDAVTGDQTITCYKPLPPVNLAVFVGVELKSTGEPTTSIPIVKSENHAKGVAEHQLYALALVAQCGGIARLVWDNGGKLGILREAKLIHHALVFQQSRQSEERGKGKGPQGSRSIPWSAFEPTDYVNIAGHMVIDILRLGENE